MQTTDINCPISLLKELQADVLKQDWSNTTGQKLVSQGVELAIRRLEKHGFVEISKDELAVEPLPKIDDKQIDLPLQMV